MGKNKSRDKGSRVERLLVHMLREMGYRDAKRVPLSGMSEGYKHDVVFTYGNRPMYIEVKSRKNTFKSLYDFMFAHLHKKVFAFHKDEYLACFGFSLNEVLNYDGIYYSNWQEAGRMMSRIEWIDSLRAGADIVALKGDRQPFIFYTIRKMPHEDLVSLT